MEKISKRVIDAVIKISVTKDVPPLGEIVTQDLFKYKVLALAINIEGKDELLFASDASSGQVQNTILKLTEIVALLEKLEKYRYIFVIESANSEGDLFYEKKTALSRKQLPNQYSIGDDLILTAEANEPMKIIENGRVIMEGVPVSQLLMTPLKRFFSGIILPTKALKDYKKRKYMALEEYHTRRGLFYSVLSMIIAIAIAVFSPIVSIWLGNRCSISTIKKEQMDSILHGIKMIKIEPQNKEKTDSSYHNHSQIGQSQTNTNNKPENNE